MGSLAAAAMYYAVQCWIFQLGAGLLTICLSPQSKVEWHDACRTAKTEQRSAARARPADLERLAVADGTCTLMLLTCCAWNHSSMKLSGASFSFSSRLLTRTWTLDTKA